EPTKASIGFTPYTTNGYVHRRQPCTSTTHEIVASVMAAIPAVKTTYELVQIALFIGNTHPHMAPATTAIAPAAKMWLSRWARGVGAASQRPTCAPRSTVPAAGRVESTPSGSHVLDAPQR